MIVGPTILAVMLLVTTIACVIISWPMIERYLWNLQRLYDRPPHFAVMAHEMGEKAIRY